MSATFFLLSSIPKGQFPKLVHVVTKQDYGIYSESTKVTWSKNQALQSLLKIPFGSLMDFIIPELYGRLNEGGRGHGQLALGSQHCPLEARDTCSLWVSTQRKTGVEGWDFIFCLDLALLPQLPADCVRFWAWLLPSLLGSRRLLRVAQWTQKGTQTTPGRWRLNLPV